MKLINIKNLLRLEITVVFEVDTKNNNTGINNRLKLANNFFWLLIFILLCLKFKNIRTIISNDVNCKICEK